MSAQQLQACLEGCAAPVRAVASVMQQEAERFQVRVPCHVHPSVVLGSCARPAGLPLRINGSSLLDCWGQGRFQACGNECQNKARDFASGPGASQVEAQGVLDACVDQCAQAQLSLLATFKQRMGSLLSQHRETA